MNRQELMEKLIGEGIPNYLAESMVENMMKESSKKTSSKPRAFNRREKITVPLTLRKKCLSCGYVHTYKEVKTIWDDEPREQDCITVFCTECVTTLQKMKKEELLSIIIMHNHPDVELRQQSLNWKMRMASKRSPQEWLNFKIDYRKGAEDEE